MADEKVTLYRDVNNGQEGMDPDFQRWFPKTIDEAVLLTDDGSSSTETNLKTRLANLKATISNLEQEAKTLTSTVNQIKNNYMLKSMMSNTQVNDTNKVPTSALAYAMNQRITDNSEDIAELNGNLNNYIVSAFFRGTEIDIPAESTTENIKVDISKSIPSGYKLLAAFPRASNGAGTILSYVVGNPDERTAEYRLVNTTASNKKTTPYIGLLCIKE